MATTKAADFVVCVNNAEYPASLKLHKAYKVLADDSAKLAGDVRIVDESGEDYLYPVTYFLALETLTISDELASERKEHKART